MALYLNARNNITGYSIVSVGTTTACLVSSTEIMRQAILTDAVGIILAHNHPSGDPEASDEDIEITKKIDDAAKLFDVKLLDHIIIGTAGTYFSLQEEGKI